MKKEFKKINLEDIIILSMILIALIIVFIIGFKADRFNDTIAKQQDLITQQQNIIDAKNFEIERINSEKDEVYYLFTKCMEDN